MTTLQTDTPVAPSSPSSNQMQLKLDIFADGQWTHTLELPVGKCTIGSSTSCQIRLTEGQVRPLHCLLLRNEKGITATSWAPGVLLNEQEFTSSPFYAGDVLTIGSLQLKLTVSDPPGSDSRQQDVEGDSDPTAASPDQKPFSDLPPRQSVDSSNMTDCSELPTVPLNEELQGNDARIAISKQQTRERCRRLIKSLRIERAQLAISQHEAAAQVSRLQIKEHEHDTLSAELEAVRNSTNQEIQQLTKRLQASECERETIASALEQLQVHAKSEAGSFADQLQSSQNERDSLAAEFEQLRTDTSGQIHQLTEQLQTSEVEREGIASTLEQLQFQAQNEADSFADQLQSFQSERNTLAAELEQLRTDTSGQIDQLTEQLQTSEAEREGIASTLEQLQFQAQNEADSFADQLQSSQSERDSLAAELEQLRTDTSGQIDQLTEQLQSANCEREKISTELEQLHSSIADREAQHSSEVDRILGELSEAYEKSNQVEATLQETQAQSSDLRRRIEELGTEREQLVEANQALHTEKEQTALSLAQREDRISHIETELQAARDAVQLAEEKLTEQIRSREEIEAELSALRANHADIVSEHERLQIESSEMQHDFPALQQRLQESEESLKASNEQIERLNSELDSLRHELDSLRDERDQLKEGYENLTTENAEQRKRNELLEIDVKSLKNEWQQAQADAMRLKEARLAAESRVEQLEAEYAGFDQESFEAISSERTQLSEQVQLLQGDLAERKVLLQSAETRFEELQAIISQSESEHATMAEEMASRVCEIERLNSELDVLKKSADQHCEERSLLEGHLKDRDNQIEEFHLQMDAFKSSITQVEQERDEVSQRLSDQEAQYAKLKTELETLRADGSRQEREHQQHAEALTARESQIAQLTDELEKVLTKIAEVEQERSVLVEQLAAQADQTAELSNELEAIRSKDSQQEETHEEYAQCIATQVDQIEQLTSQLEALHARVSLVEQERDHVAQRLEASEATVEQLTVDLDQSRELLAECAQQATNLKLDYEMTLEELDQARSSNQLTQPIEVEEVPTEPHSESESLMEETSNEIGRETNETVVLLSGATDLTSKVEENHSTEPTPEFQPTSFIDKYSHLLDENELGSGGSSLESPPTPVTRSAETVKLSDLSSSTGDDGDLEAYMSSLMRRVRGEISSDSTGPSKTKECEANGKHESQNSYSRENPVTGKQKETEETPSPENLGLLDLDDLKATSKKPTQPIDLTAMRELANTSARSAIAKHRKRRHFEGALGKTLVTTVAGGTSACMILSAEHYAHPLFLGGCAVGVVSAYWGLKLLGTLLEMIRDGDSSTEAIPTDLSEELDPLPIDG